MARRQLPRHKRLLIRLGVFLCLLIALAAAYIIYIFSASPAVIRDPYLQHYHFRLQILVDGQLQDFGSDKYQTPESNLSCDVALPTAPIHFHDHKNQIVHVHWDGMTGGLLLKDYGWNYVGGINGALGYRFDRLPHIQKVSIHGYDLPAVPKGDNFYIYTGNQNSYKQRSLSDFLKQDFEVFFNHPSTLPSSKPKAVFLNWLTPTAYAHEVIAANLSEPQLQQLNNLIGNAVIFVQKSRPTDAQVKGRFNQLEPLSQSVCGS